MKDLIIVSDFDGTITKEDGLYSFIKTYAADGWEIIEQAWIDGKISSKECLEKEFELVPDLSEDLIDTFIQSIDIDNSFIEFYKKINNAHIDFCIASDGLDYFITHILKKYGLNNFKVYTNHAEFRNGIFELSFPNDSSKCMNNSGTCKCEIINNLKKNYKKVVYIGDGASDFCAADKADILFAKSKLADYCLKNNIDFQPFNSFNDILNNNFIPILCS